MTIEDLMIQLKKLLKELESHSVNDRKKRELQILILQAEIQLDVVSYDPLKQLDSVSVVDTGRLEELIGEVQVEIENEMKRSALVDKVIGTTKVALKAAGIPIPS